MVNKPDISYLKPVGPSIIVSSESVAFPHSVSLEFLRLCYLCFSVSRGHNCARRLCSHQVDLSNGNVVHGVIIGHVTRVDTQIHKQNKQTRSWLVKIMWYASFTTTIMYRNSRVLYCHEQWQHIFSECTWYCHHHVCSNQAKMSGILV